MNLTSLSTVFTLSSVLLAGADFNYYRHVLFDNSLTPERYYFSDGRAIAPSKLNLQGGKLPVDRENFHTPPNAVRLQWKSVRGGSWESVIRLERWRNHPVTFDGDTLYFWCYPKELILPEQLPRVQLVDSHGGFSATVNLEKFVHVLPLRRWTEVKIPLRAFSSISFQPLEPLKLDAVCYLQGASDGTEHSLVLDDIKIDWANPAGKISISAPTDLNSTGYDRHIDLTWTPGKGDPQHFLIYRSFDGVLFQPIGIQSARFRRYADFLGRENRKAFYKIRAVDRAFRESGFSNKTVASTHPLDDDELLTMVQEACFRYYWENAHPDAGMTLESTPGDDNMVATGASGFGIMAMIVGAKRGFIRPVELNARLEKILTFLDKADRYHGAWPHFLDGRTGKTMPVFGKYDNGGDLVETAFLMQGLLAARQYVKDDAGLSKRISHLWESVEWDWYRKTADSEFLYWHWSSDYTWRINHKLIGWNETMIVYLLAIASPTHPVPASLYHSGWAGQAEEAVRYRSGMDVLVEGDHYANGHSYYGIKLDVGAGRGGPLFFTHYSFLGFDPRELRDNYTDYFENNRNIARINRAYCIENPHHYPEYGERCWGITASDGPWGYRAHEPKFGEDTGTMTPTGALASYAYTPDASMEALKYFYFELGDRLWNIYGFRDAFNLKENWFAQIYMGLNQAPITVMIENRRSGLVWKLFMSNPEISPMLERIGSKASNAGE